MLTPPAPTLYEPPGRLETLDSARSYIDAIDFSRLKERMTVPPDHGGTGWTIEKVDYVERQYKNWLFLRRKYEDRPLPPSADIDVFWHNHMLDSRAYFRDTSHVFGYYLHHYPYFGIGGEKELAELEDAWEEVQRLHLIEFGDEIYDFD